MRALFVGLWCVSAVAFAGALDISAPPPGRWAKDTSGKISQATLAALDQIAEGVNQTGHGQLGVLVVRTTEGQIPRVFATAVFNAWGIGHSEYKNGLFLFVALDDRKAEIVLGDGLNQLSTSDTDELMRDHVVSHFKAGKPEQALLEGARALAALLAQKPRANAAQPLVPNVASADAFSEAQVAQLLTTGQITDPSPRRWVIDLTGSVPSSTMNTLERLPNELYASNGRPLFIVIFKSWAFEAEAVRERALASLSVKHPRAAVLAVNDGRRDAAFRLPEDLHEDPRASTLEVQVASAASNQVGLDNLVFATMQVGDVMRDGFPQRSASEVVSEVIDRHGPIFFGFGGVLLVGGAFWGRRWNRYRSRPCEPCQRPRQLLPAGAEDKYLSDGQKTEQKIGAIDYDVWWCGVCDSVLLRNNSAWFAGYSKCKGCSNKALKSTSTTLKRATEYSSGLVQVNEKCAHCNHTNSYTRTTARITRSTSSSSSSSLSSSSSSSSRSSFGGGSSSGRGSSGSW